MTDTNERAKDWPDNAMDPWAGALGFGLRLVDLQKPASYRDVLAQGYSANWMAYAIEHSDPLLKVLTLSDGSRQLVQQQEGRYAVVCELPSDFPAVENQTTIYEFE